MSAHSVYKSYKHASKGIFTPIDQNVQVSTESVYQYMRSYKRFVECGQKRIQYRDKFVRPDKRDVGHEYAIESCFSRSKEVEKVLVKFFNEKRVKENVESKREQVKNVERIKPAAKQIKKKTKRVVTPANTVKSVSKQSEEDDILNAYQITAFFEDMQRYGDQFLDLYDEIRRTKAKSDFTYDDCTMTRWFCRLLFANEKQINLRTPSEEMYQKTRDLFWQTMTIAEAVYEDALEKEPLCKIMFSNKADFIFYFGTRLLGFIAKETSEKQLTNTTEDYIDNFNNIFELLYDIKNMKLKNETLALILKSTKSNLGKSVFKRSIDKFLLNFY